MAAPTVEFPESAAASMVGASINPFNKEFLHPMKVPANERFPFEFQSNESAVGSLKTRSDAVHYTMMTPRVLEGQNYKDLFGMLVGTPLAHGQRLGRDPEFALDEPGRVWLNYHYFPAIVYNPKANQWQVEMYAVFYSSFKPTNELVGHEARWIETGVKLTGASVNLDARLIGNLDAQLSVLSALNIARPTHASYIWISNMGLPNALNFDPAPLPIRGASLGLAMALAILFAPPVASTGFVKKLAPNVARITRSDEGGFLMDPAAHADDLVEEVQGLGLKMGYAVEKDFPLIIPHKTSLNQPVREIMQRQNKSSGKQLLLVNYAPYAYSTVEMDQGQPYSGRKAPILLATTLPEAIILSVVAWISYVCAPAATWSEAGREKWSGPASDYVQRMRAVESGARAKASERNKEMRIDPVTYAARQGQKAIERTAATASKASKKLEEKMSKTRSKADARTKAAADKLKKEKKGRKAGAKSAVAQALLQGKPTQIRTEYQVPYPGAPPQWGTLWGGQPSVAPAAAPMAAPPPAQPSEMVFTALPVRPRLQPEEPFEEEESIEPTQRAKAAAAKEMKPGAGKEHLKKSGEEKRKLRESARIKMSRARSLSDIAAMLGGISDQDIISRFVYPLKGALDRWAAGDATLDELKAISAAAIDASGMLPKSADQGQLLNAATELKNLADAVKFANDNDQAVEPRLLAY